MNPQDNPNRSFSVFIDHPLFCLLSIIIIGSTVVRCVREIMEPINTIAERKSRGSGTK